MEKKLKLQLILSLIIIAVISFSFSFRNSWRYNHFNENMFSSDCYFPEFLIYNHQHHDFINHDFQKILDSVRNLKLLPKSKREALQDTIIPEFYDSGHYKGLITYRNGVPHGMATYFYKTGETKRICYYKNGILDGDDTGYFISGQLKYCKFNKNGKEFGYQQIYKESGGLDSTYTVEATE